MSFPPGFTPIDEELPAGFTLIQGGKKEPTIGANQNPALEVDAQGNRITRNPDGSVKFIQGPGFSGNADTSPDRNVATIGVFDITPDDVLSMRPLWKGASVAARGVSNLVGKVGLPSPETLRRGAEIVGSPWKEGTKAVLNKGAELLERRAGVPPVSVPTAAVPAAAEAVAPSAAQSAPSIVRGGIREPSEIVSSASRTVAPVIEKAAVFNPTKALQAAKEAFSAIGETPLRGEASNAMEFILAKTPTFSTSKPSSPFDVEIRPL